MSMISSLQGHRSTVSGV